MYSAMCFCTIQRPVPPLWVQFYVSLEHLDRFCYPTRVLIVWMFTTCIPLHNPQRNSYGLTLTVALITTLKHFQPQIQDVTDTVALKIIFFNFFLAAIHFPGRIELLESSSPRRIASHHRPMMWPSETP